jgi:hypothetical protein
MRSATLAGAVALAVSGACPALAALERLLRDLKVAASPATDG